MVSKSPLEQRRRQMRRNLVRLYQSSDVSSIETGRQWYSDARLMIDAWSSSTGVSAPTIACVISAISPQCDWTNNVEIARALVFGESAHTTGGALPTNITKARRILANGVSTVDDVESTMRQYFPYGPKVNAFARNLAGDERIATVDSHAYEAARNDCRIRQTLNANRYRIVADCYAYAADVVGESIPTFQAITWIEWKRRYPRTDKRERRKHASRLHRMR